MPPITVSDLRRALKDVPDEAVLELWFGDQLASHLQFEGYERRITSREGHRDEWCFRITLDPQEERAVLEELGETFREQVRAEIVEDVRKDLIAEVVEAGPEQVVVDVLISKDTHRALRTLVWRCNGSHARSDGANTHGALTVSTLLGMLAEDAGLVETRPGSWEGANMAQVFGGHGYVV